MGKKIIVDFDNTMGVDGCDLDDGLALLFLLGSDDITVNAACTTYGNSDIETVHSNTLRLFDELALDIPVYRGASSPHDPFSDAAHYLARAAADHPGEFSILATGSLTNLRGAALLDEHFLENVREIGLMGGISRSLVINGRIMDELNLSCDPTAAITVLNAPCPVAVATAQNCLPAFFRREDFISELGARSWLYETGDYWFRHMSREFGENGFVIWDIVAAAWLARPDLFEGSKTDVTLNERLLSVGYLEEAPEGAPRTSVTMPIVKEGGQFKKEVFIAWRKALTLLGR